MKMASISKWQHRQYRLASALADAHSPACHYLVRAKRQMRTYCGNDSSIGGRRTASRDVAGGDLRVAASRQAYGRRLLAQHFAALFGRAAGAAGHRGARERKMKAASAASRASRICLCRAL